MIDAEIKARLVDRSVLGLTMYGEARGARVEARIAVGCVARNRTRWPARYRATASHYKAICLAPKQFSCWNGGDANYAAVMAQAERIVHGPGLDDLVLQECLYLADGIIERALLDNTRGSTFYIETSLFETHPPLWVTRVTKTGTVGPFTLFADAPEKAV